MDDSDENGNSNSNPTTPGMCASGSRPSTPALLLPGSKGGKASSPDREISLLNNDLGVRPLVSHLSSSYCQYQILHLYVVSHKTINFVKFYGNQGENNLLRPPTTR